MQTYDVTVGVGMNQMAYQGQLSLFGDAGRITCKERW